MGHLANDSEKFVVFTGHGEEQAEGAWPLLSGDSGDSGDSGEEVPQNTAG